MRWDNLTLSGTSAQDALFGAGEVTTRTFDTPEFRGMTFYEVRARSVLNKVPGASRMSFEWTVNPYRGCSHACRYCLRGDTPILMADGRTRQLMDLRVGDSIYGTVHDGNYRRYAITEVLAHWRTVKPAYRVMLDDGTELVASGDHRFLTDKGWKHVTGRMRGVARRPYLTVGDRLSGTGRFVTPPEESTDYRRGYLCGVGRDGARLGARYLVDGGARPRRADVQPRAAGGALLTIPATRDGAHPGSGVGDDVIRWSGCVSDGWAKGFLAGVFDADGSCADGTLRISKSDPEIIDSVTSCLTRLGFVFSVESFDGLRRVRLLGGVRERLRFFHAVDPTVDRNFSIAAVAVENGAHLRVVSVEDLGVELPMYDITTGTGDFIANGVVSHNCFARRTHEYLDLDTGIDFDSKIVVKVNAPELLRKELASARWAGDHVAMGTNVDPYQRVEGRYRLMPGILEALRDARNPFSILTKGTLVLRDLGVLREAARVSDVSVNVSVGFVDKALWRQVEHGAPSPSARLGVCRALSDAGIGCGVLMAPILPYLTDSPSQLEAAVSAIADTGARSVTPLVLHLRPGSREWYLAWLQREHPELVGRYRELYGDGSYALKAYQRRIAAVVAELTRRYGVGAVPPGGG